MAIRKAEKRRTKARILVTGGPGTGKTLTALSIGNELAVLEGTKLGGIDTENERMDAYAGHFTFDVDSDFKDKSPETYIEKLKDFERSGYGVVVVDSISHEWKYCLNLVDKLTAESADKNSFAKWGLVTPRHEKFIEALINFNGHIICTGRVKTKYKLERNDRGKVAPQKVGLDLVQREGLEYEFSLELRLDRAHNGYIEKSFYDGYLTVGETYHKPGKDIAQKIWEWSQTAAQSLTYTGLVAQVTSLIQSGATLDKLVAMRDQVAMGTLDGLAILATPEQFAELNARFAKAIEKLMGKAKGASDGAA